MAFPSGEQIDIIATRILLDAREAIQQLKAWNNTIDQTATKMAMIHKTVKEGVLNATGGLKNAAPNVKAFFDSIKIDPAALAGMQKVPLIQNLISATARQMGGNIGAATSAVQKFAGALNLNPALIRQIGNEMQGVGNKAESGFHRALTAVNALRIAMGVLVSMLLFQGIQAVTQFFKSAVDQARQFEATLYRIANVERQLSLEGIDVSVRGLKDGIKDIQDALPIFSKEDVAQLVGSVATTTKELGYTEDQILQLSAAFGILNINSTETESILQTAAKGINSLVSPQAKSIGNLGLSFGKAKIEAKAFEMQILKAGESFADLSEKEKQDIKFQIILETAGIEDIPIDKLREEIQKAGGDFEALNAYLESNDAKLLENSAAWMDLKTTLGQIILPFLPALTEFFKAINDGLNVGKVLIVEFLTGLGAFGVVMRSVFSGNIKSVEDFRNTLRQSTDILREDLVNTFFKEVPKDAPDWFMRGWGDLIHEQAETATDGLEQVGQVDEEETLEMLDNIEKKLTDIILEAKQAREDLDLKLSQKQADLDVEYDRKAQDAAADHANKLRDINQDALDKIEDAKRKAREDEKKAEQDLLQKLKELRQRFLMDLEDALHARDARQILRLIKEYNFEKQNLLDRKKLDDQQRKERLANELRDIEIERKRRIEQAKIEYKRKLEDLRLAKQREQEELALWYQREQEDIQRNIEQKLEKLLNGYITEGEITEEQMSKISGILARHFRDQMDMVDRLVAYMQSRFAQIGSMGIGGLPQVYVQSEKEMTPVSEIPAFAEGGTLIARKPTLAMFGETPEIAQFTPLSKLAGMRMSGSFDGGAGGELGLQILLSPDLEARIVRNTMERTGRIVTQIRRSK